MYRAGYSAARRRAVEAQLSSGALLATVSTSALELGIDVGHVDATLHLGLPPTIASLWQQAGRAGRVAGRQALTLIVAQDNPLEQHFAARPLELLARKVEAAAANPLNAALLRAHLLAAAAEAPLRLPPPIDVLGGSAAHGAGQQGAKGQHQVSAAGEGLMIKVEAAMDATRGGALVACAGAVHAGEGGGVQPGGEPAVTAREEEPRPPTVTVKLAPSTAVPSQPAPTHLVPQPAVSASPPLQIDPAPSSAAAITLAIEPEPELCAWAEWSGPAQQALAARELRMLGERLEATDRGRAVVKAISLRGIGRDRVRVVALDAAGGGGSGAGRLGGYGAVELESMELPAAKLRLYAGAVYMHLGESYVVDELDTEERVARVHREDVGYYTEPRDHVKMAILHRRGYGVAPAGCGPGVLAFWGPMRASRSVYGYRRKARATGRLIELADLETPLPPDEFDTVGLWLEPPSALRDGGPPGGIGGPPTCVPSSEVGDRGSALLPSGGYARGGLHAVEHLLIGLAPLAVSCDGADLACQCTRRRGDEHAERLLIFERRPGGAGITEQLLPRLGELLAAAHRRLAACGCGAPGGCPGCIQIPRCGEYNEGLDRRAADRVLRWALGMGGEE